MKKLNFILSIMLLALVVSAQEVKQVDKTMSLGNKPAYYVEVNDIEKKVVEKAWEEYVKSYGKMKDNKKAKESYMNQVSIPMINGSNKIDFYSKQEEGRNQITTYVWIDLGGAFANPTDHAKQAEGAKQFLFDFWVFAKKKSVSNELEDQEKVQKDLEKDLSKLEGKNEDLKKDIEKYKEKIRQAEIEIEQNFRDQDNKKVDIATQKKVIEKVVDKLNAIGKQ
jgi:hypothetical protein